MPGTLDGEPVRPPVELVSTIAPPRPLAIIDGMATRPVFQTPVRLTPMTSSHCCSADAKPPGPDAGRWHHDGDRAERGGAGVERLLQRLRRRGRRPRCATIRPPKLLSTSRTVWSKSSRDRHLVADRLDLLADVDGDDVGTVLRQPNRVERGPGRERRR